jgi:hypothetical protein
MAIERTELSGSLNGNAMEPVASTPAAQNQAAPEPGENKQRRRESSAKKDSGRDKPSPDADGIDGWAVEQVEKAEKAEQTEQTEQAKRAEQTVEEDRPPHRIDSLA